MTAFERPSRAGLTSYATNWPSTNVFGGFNVVDTHKNIGAAAIGHDEAKSAICIEEFGPPSWHELDQVDGVTKAPKDAERGPAACRIWSRARTWATALPVDGEDLRREPIERRKVLLIRLLAKALVGLQVKDHIVAPSDVVFRHACKLGFEGIVSRHWVKSKNPQHPAVKREGEEDWGKERWR